MCDDRDISLQEYSDDDLITNLRIGIMLLEASWDNGYKVVLNTNDHNNQFYEIVGNKEPEQWLLALYLLKTLIGMRVFQQIYSFDNKVIKITNTSKKEDLEALNQLYDEIIETRKNTAVGYVFTSFDDYFTRYYDILDSISEGFR
jgi:hypothetical protein